MNAETVVRNFCEAFARQDLDELLGYFADDAVYENVPIGVNKGKAAIRTTLQQFVDPTAKAAFEVHALAASGPVVLTERTDTLTLNGKPVSLRVMGAFEVDPGGKIAAWRDYFDMGQLTQQLA